MSRPVAAAPRVAFLTLGCGRNEVDSEQLGGALQAAGFRVEEDPQRADCVVVNTCTFIGPARQESIDVILEACDLPGQVVVVGCMAQRHQAELQDALPEVARVVGFADYGRLPAIVAEVVGTGAGPRDGSRAQDPAGAAAAPGAVSSPAALLPVVSGPRLRWPTRDAAPAPPTAAFPARTTPRGPWAYLKIAGGCDRVCTFCTIPSYRGRFASRPADELVAEARWLTSAGARELVCVSENTTSWGKDLPEGRRGIAALLGRLAAVEGLARLRLLYLQPAEIVPELLDAMAALPAVAGYYDLSLQHASPGVLARMGRSGSAERFLDLLAGIRARDPRAVFRSSFIVGFPGEREQDVALLADFLEEARLDWVGFFPFSPEEGTPAAALGGQVPADEARARCDELLDVAESVAAGCAAAWVGRELEVLCERSEEGAAVGRSHREGPETDGEVRLPGVTAVPGALVRCVVTGTDGVDLVAAPLASPRRAPAGAGVRRLHPQPAR